MANLLSSVPDPNPVTTAKKTLIIAHRTELLEQARRQILRFYPHLVKETLRKDKEGMIHLTCSFFKRVVIDQGTRKPDISSADVVVASVQTLGRTGSCRLERYDPLQFKTIMIDEVSFTGECQWGELVNNFAAARSIMQPPIPMSRSSNILVHYRLILIFTSGDARPPYDGTTASASALTLTRLSITWTCCK